MKFKEGQIVWAIWGDISRHPNHKGGAVILPGMITGISTVLMHRIKGKGDQPDRLEMVDYMAPLPKDTVILTTYTINHTGSTQEIFATKEDLMQSKTYQILKDREVNIRELAHQEI